MVHSESFLVENRNFSFVFCKGKTKCMKSSDCVIKHPGMHSTGLAMVVSRGVETLPEQCSICVLLYSMWWFVGENCWHSNCLHLVPLGGSVRLL